MKTSIEDIYNQLEIQTTWNVYNFEKDKEVSVTNEYSTITGLLIEKPTIFSKRFKEPKVGYFMVPIKFSGNAKDDVLSYNSYETQDSDSKLMKITMNFENKYVEISNTDGNIIERISFKSEILDQSLISFHKNPIEEKGYIC